MKNYVDILWNKNICILQCLLVLLPDTALLRMLLIQVDIFFNIRYNLYKGVYILETMMLIYYTI